MKDQGGKYNRYTKYNSNCKVLRAMFDHIHLKEIPSFGVKGNMVVLSGEAIESYLKYAEKNLASSGKMVTMELETTRAKRLAEKVKALAAAGNLAAKRTKVVQSDVFCYDTSVDVREFIKTPARIEDLAVGCCNITQLTQEAIIRLLRQQRVLKGKKKKVQILSGVRRGSTDASCVSAFNLYLIPLQKKISKINGIDVTEDSVFWKKSHVGSGVFTKGKKLPLDLPDKLKPCEHSVELIDTKGGAFTIKQRPIELKLYTFTASNCGMLASVLKYK